MFYNNLVTSYRNLRKNLAYNLINIFGLGLAITCVFIIVLYVIGELSFDTFHKNYENIYRLELNLKQQDKCFATNAIPLAPAFTSEFPEIRYSTRLFPRETDIRIDKADPDNLQSEPVLYNEKGFYFVDSTIFNVFTFDFITGNELQALNQPNTAIITESTATKYFGENWISVFGKNQNILYLDNKSPVKVTGVVKDFPYNSHFSFDILASFETMYVIEGEEISKKIRNNWFYNPVYIYTLLNKEASRQEIENKLPDFLKRHAGENFANMVYISLKPLKDIHLYSNIVAEIKQNGNIKHIYILLVIALVAVSIASLNYINLSISLSLRRAKEVGVRKVLGAEKTNIVVQYLGESILLSFITFLVAIGLLILLFPLIRNNFINEIKLSEILSLKGLYINGILFVFVGLSTGIFPAIFMSRMKSIDILKNQLFSKTKRSGIDGKTILILFQSFISFILIFFAIAVQKQYKTLTDIPLGFEESKMVFSPIRNQDRNNELLKIDKSLIDKLESFSVEILKDPNVEAMTLTSRFHHERAFYTNVVSEDDPEAEPLSMSYISVDENFISAYELDILEGRDFSKQGNADEMNSCIINEKAVAQFGWNSNNPAVGKRIKLFGHEKTIVGVVKDFHFRNVYEPIEPLVLDIAPEKFNFITIRINPQNRKNAIENITKNWDQFFSTKMFTYSFLEDDLNNLYLSENKLGLIVLFFSFFTIFICCLGLLGSLMHNVNQRVKEIGIRKVNGAETFDIILFILKKYLLIIVVGIILAIPVSYVIVSFWLKNYVYKMDLNIFLIFIPTIIIIITSLLTIGYVTVKSALINPVETLKTE